MSPVENDGFSIFIFWSSREEAKSKRLVNVSHAMFALKYSHWNVNGLFLFLFRLWKLNLFKFLLLQLLFLDDNKLHSKSKVRSLEMTILRSPWDQKWACPNLLRRENDWNQSMKSFRNEISHDMEAEKYEAALNNICQWEWRSHLDSTDFGVFLAAGAVTNCSNCRMVEFQSGEKASC